LSLLDNFHVTDTVHSVKYTYWSFVISHQLSVNVLKVKGIPSVYVHFKSRFVPVPQKSLTLDKELSGL